MGDFRASSSFRAGSAVVAPHVDKLSVSEGEDLLPDGRDSKENGNDHNR